MPTAIVLDTSLSMAKSWDSVSSRTTKLDCARRAVRKLALVAAEKFKQDSIALYTFSSEAKCVVDFTRDFEKIANALEDLSIGDTSGVQTALQCVSDACVKDASSSTSQTRSGLPYRILLFTDGDYSVDESKQFDETVSSLKRAILRVRDDYDALALHSIVLGDGDSVAGSENSVLTKITVAVNRTALDPVLESASDSNFKSVLCGLDRRPQPDDAGNESSANVDWQHFPYYTVTRNEASLMRVIDAIVEDAYAPVTCAVRCGGLQTQCELRPRLMRERAVHYDESLSIPRRLVLSGRELRIVGCSSLSDIGAPPTCARHVLVPLREQRTESGSSPTPGVDANNSPANLGEEETSTAETHLQAANSAVLLHGALKAENLVAIAQVAPAWFALVHPRTDVKKRSNLVVTVLPPGYNCVPWLADRFSSIAVRRSLREVSRDRRRARRKATEEDSSSGSGESAPAPKKLRLASGEDAGQSDESSFSSDSDADSDVEALGLRGPESSNPAASASYSGASAYQTWTRVGALHSDVQRVLRNARKFEKQSAFFRELNRLKRFALQLGFVELLAYVSNLIDGEYQAVVASGFSISDQPEKSHVAAQLRSVALQLRSPLALNPDYQILPAQAAVLTIPPPTSASGTATTVTSTASTTSTSTAVSNTNTATATKTTASTAASSTRTTASAAHK